MRVLFTGQTGLDKKAHLQRLREYSARRGRSIDEVYHIGDMMYEESKKSGFALKEGKILDLPLAHLGALRRAAFNLIPNEPSDGQHAFINSHAVFRWDNRLFRAFELAEVRDVSPDFMVNLIDDVDTVKARLDGLKDSDKLPADTRYSLKDLLIWREEEMLASEILASVLDIPHYVLGVWLEEEVSDCPLEVVYSLMFEPWKRKAYVSFPIRQAQARQETWERVVRYRKIARAHLTAFDPMMINEKESSRSFDPRDVELIADDIDGQIVARDFKLIDQSDMVLVYFPQDADGRPIIAGGVQSELEHAAASTKDIVIVWESSSYPTPFIEQRGDVLLHSLDELEDYLKSTSRPPGQQEMSLS